MSDIQLLTFGCAITFLAAAGGYVAVREQFLHGFFDRVFERRRVARQRVARQPVEPAKEGARS